MKKSKIHENVDANITCDFGDGDISRYRSRLPHTHGHSHGQAVSSIIVRYAPEYGQGFSDGGTLFVFRLRIQYIVTPSVAMPIICSTFSLSGPCMWTE